MRVLIADDEPLAVERLSRLVTQMGHEVIATAHHGQDVLNHIENDSPDVVLLDIQNARDEWSGVCRTAQPA